MNQVFLIYKAGLMNRYLMGAMFNLDAAKDYAKSKELAEKADGDEHAHWTVDAVVVLKPEQGKS